MKLYQDLIVTLLLRGSNGNLHKKYKVRVKLPNTLRIRRGDYYHEDIGYGIWNEEDVVVRSKRLRRLIAEHKVLCSLLGHEQLDVELFLYLTK